MDIQDTRRYSEALIAALVGRRISPGYPPNANRGRPMFSFWGEELGFSGGDVHSTRAYRVYLDLDGDTIVGGQVVVEGEIISPCSGYFVEQLDEFDFETVKNWCLERTLA